YRIESLLEYEQKVFPSNPLAPVCSGEIATELAFENTIDAFNFLFLAQLQAILRWFGSALSMLPRRVISACNSTFLAVAAFALQEELHAFSAAETTDRIRVACQRCSPLYPLWLVAI